jgi:uncharacterized protein (DUF169 family)
MLTTLECAKLSANLVNALRLDQPPIAICFAERVPDELAAPPMRVPAGCRFWEEATSATFATSANDHSMCAIGVYTHNLEPSQAQEADLMDAIKVFGDLGYVRQEELPLIPVLASRPKYVVYAPLARTPMPPDVVIVFADASQTLVLSEAVTQVEGQNAPAMGRPACAVVPQVLNTGRAALSLGCCGARAYLDVLTESQAIFAFPGASLDAYVDRVLALAKANAVLSQFHRMRRQAVANGHHPSIQDSLRAVGVG